MRTAASLRKVARSACERLVGARRCSGQTRRRASRSDAHAGSSCTSRWSRASRSPCLSFGLCFADVKGSSPVFFCAPPLPHLHHPSFGQTRALCAYLYFCLLAKEKGVRSITLCGEVRWCAFVAEGYSRLARHRRPQISSSFQFVQFVLHLRTYLLPEGFYHTFGTWLQKSELSLDANVTTPPDDTSHRHREPQYKIKLR